MVRKSKLYFRPSVIIDMHCASSQTYSHSPSRIEIVQIRKKVPMVPKQAKHTQAGCRQTRRGTERRVAPAPGCFLVAARLSDASPSTATAALVRASYLFFTAAFSSRSLGARKNCALIWLSFNLVKPNLYIYHFLQVENLVTRTT